MSRYDSMDTVEWLLIGALLLLIAGGLFAIGFLGYEAIGNSRAKDACRDKGGLVEHYDTKHEGYWRCSVSAEVKP